MLRGGHRDVQDEDGYQGYRQQPKAENHKGRPAFPGSRADHRQGCPGLAGTSKQGINFAGSAAGREGEVLGSCGAHAALLALIRSTARSRADAARGFSVIATAVGTSVPLVRVFSSALCSSSSTGKPSGAEDFDPAWNTPFTILSSSEW